MSPIATSNGSPSGEAKAGKAKFTTQEIMTLESEYSA